MVCTTRKKTTWKAAFFHLMCGQLSLLCPTLKNPTLLKKPQTIVSEIFMSKSIKGDDHGALGIYRHVKKKEAVVSARLAYCCVSGLLQQFSLSILAFQLEACSEKSPVIKPTLKSVVLYYTSPAKRVSVSSKSWLGNCAEHFHMQQRMKQLNDFSSLLSAAICCVWILVDLVLWSSFG